jgi:Calx-beta domain
MTHEISVRRFLQLILSLAVFVLPIVLYADCSLSIDDPTQGFEGGGGANIITFTVTKTGNSACGTIYSTSDQTATGGGQCSAGNVDYVSLFNGGLNFSATETSKTIVITTCGDSIDEPDETFVINLFTPTGGATYAKNQGRGTLVDDDPAPDVRISNASLTEGNAAQANLSLNVTLSNPSAFTITVDFATAANTATAGTNCGGNIDFLTTSGTLTFNPLTSNPKTVSVPICGDTAIESSETFRVNLSNAAHASIAVSQATATITNDDIQPNISINDVTRNEGNAGTANANFNVSLSVAGTNQITVNYTTVPVAPTVEGPCGTGNHDYEVATGTLTFNPGGALVQAVPVHICGDTVVEVNDLFRVNLSNATNANISDNQGQGTITNDDLPSISMAALQVNEGSFLRTVPITLTLSSANPAGVSVVCKFVQSNVPESKTLKNATGAASCASGIDFVSGKGQKVDFGPTETTKGCVLTICGELVRETDEGLFVTLSSPLGATIATPQTGVVLKNDD